MYMRTTIDLPDDLLKRAKMAAVERGASVRQLVIEGLQYSLAREASQPDAKRLPKLPSKGRKSYDLSNKEIESILLNESAKPYGRPS